MTYPQIRLATDSDVPAMIAIAHQYRQELGYVNPAALREHIGRGTVLVCESGGEIAGFVDYHTRRDGWQTVYHLATHRDHAGQGIGRQLLYSVPCPVRLKVTVDNEVANKFYQSAGMRLVATEPGKRRPLNVYELRVLGIFCMGNGPGDLFPRVARASGLAYGVRSSEQARAWPFMIDVDWKAFATGRLTWSDYMDMIHQCRPVMAMAVDYERPEQRPQMLAQVSDLQAAGVLRPMVCPKFDGAVAHIPAGCTVAVSVPSSYAGFVPAEPLHGRPVHLLGGVPQEQRRIAQAATGLGGLVCSYDGNAHHKAALAGTVFAAGQWRNPGRRYTGTVDTYAGTLVRSGREWHTMMQQVVDWQQLRLF